MSRSTLALIALLLVELFGVVASGVLTWHHEVALYGGVTGAGELIGCSATEHVNCDVVNTSDWSELFGVPIATWGLATYLTLVGLTTAALTGRREGLPVVFTIGLASAAYSALLYWVSVTELGFVCVWCMRLYVVNALLPILAALAGGLRGPVPKAPVWGVTAAAFVTASLLSVGAQRVYRSTLLGDAGAIDLAAATSGGASSDGAATPGALPARELALHTEDEKPAKLALLPDDAWKGNPAADVVLVEFMDLECGHCKRAAGELSRLAEAYGDRVLFVVKHYPMDPTCNPGVQNTRHRHACEAARGAVCAAEQGRFWPFHDLAFKNQHQLTTDDLAMYARAAGADLAAWEACMRSDRSQQRVLADTRAGAALGLRGTPRIYIDGKLHRGGRSAQQLALALEQALGSDAAARREAMAALSDQRVPVRPIDDDVPPVREVRAAGHTFSIDTFEAGLKDGAAVSAKREIPATHMSWFAARDACAKAGKRLCSEEEWISACQGAPAVDDDGDGEHADDLIEGTTYPYGDHHEPGRCWDGRPDGQRPVYTGEMPGCASADGVYDLTGNVEEWVGLTPETAVLLGGAFDTSQDHARCYRRNAVFGPGYANARTGFRCCAGDVP